MGRSIRMRFLNIYIFSRQPHNCSPSVDLYMNKKQLKSMNVVRGIFREA